MGFKIGVVTALPTSVLADRVIIPTLVPDRGALIGVIDRLPGLSAVVCGIHRGAAARVMLLHRSVSRLVQCARPPAVGAMPMLAHRPTLGLGRSRLGEHTGGR